MAILPILRYPDPRLHKVAKPVAVVDDEIRRLARNMAETMYAAPGVGLAATQVDVHKQLIVIDLSETRGQSDCEEGCLSVPGIFEKIARAEWVKVRALNVDGKFFTIEATGLLSVCIQHEMDHLKGKVFVEYLSRLN